MQEIEVTNECANHSLVRCAEHSKQGTFGVVAASVSIKSSPNRHQARSKRADKIDRTSAIAVSYNSPRKIGNTKKHDAYSVTVVEFSVGDVNILDSIRPSESKVSGGYYFIIAQWH